MASTHLEFYNINGARLIGDAMNKQYNISCNYKQGDKVRYKWKNDEIRSGTIIHIDCFINIKDFELDRSRSVTFADVIGYATDKWLSKLIIWFPYIKVNFNSSFMFPNI